MLGSYAHIPLLKFHLSNLQRQLFSRVWSSLITIQSPRFLPDPSCYVYHSGLRSHQQLDMPLITPWEQHILFTWLSTQHMLL